MGKLWQASLVFLLALLLAPQFPPWGLDYVGVAVKRVPLMGALKPNKLLDEAELLTTEVDETSFRKFQGPESLAEKGGYLYTGVQGGDILRINLNDPKAKWERVFHSGEPCSELHEEATKCGRPLGIEFDSKGRLVVADAVRGVYRVDLEEKREEMLVPVGSIPTEGENTGPIRMPNGLTIARDGTIYFTSLSSQFGMADGLLMMLSMACPMARVLKYDPSSGSVSVVASGLHSANGIILSPQQDSLIVAEMGKARLLEIDLVTGKSEVFAHSPGLTDNISSNGKGGYFVGLPLRVEEEGDPLFDTLIHYHKSSRFVVRIVYTLKKFLEFINHNLFSSDFLDKISYYMTSADFIKKNLPVRSLLIELDEHGNIIKSWQGEKIGQLSEALLYKGSLYLGSYTNEFVAKIPYKK